LIENRLKNQEIRMPVEYAQSENWRTSL